MAEPDPLYPEAALPARTLNEIRKPTDRSSIRGTCTRRSCRRRRRWSGTRPACRRGSTGRRNACGSTTRRSGRARRATVPRSKTSPQACGPWAARPPRFTRSPRWRRPARRRSPSRSTRGPSTRATARCSRRWWCSTPTVRTSPPVPIYFINRQDGETVAGNPLLEYFLEVAMPDGTVQRATHWVPSDSTADPRRQGPGAGRSRTSGRPAMRLAIEPIAAGLLAWTIVLAVATRSFATRIFAPRVPRDCSPCTRTTAVGTSSTTAPVPSRSPLPPTARPICISCMRATFGTSAAGDSGARVFRSILTFTLVMEGPGAPALQHARAALIASGAPSSVEMRPLPIARVDAALVYTPIGAATRNWYRIPSSNICRRDGGRRLLAQPDVHGRARSADRAAAVERDGKVPGRDERRLRVLRSRPCARSPSRVAGGPG